MASVDHHCAAKVVFTSVISQAIDLLARLDCASSSEANGYVMLYQPSTQQLIFYRLSTGYVVVQVGSTLNIDYRGQRKYLKFVVRNTPNSVALEAWDLDSNTLIHSVSDTSGSRHTTGSCVGFWLNQSLAGSNVIWLEEWYAGYEPDIYPDASGAHPSAGEYSDYDLGVLCDAVGNIRRYNGQIDVFKHDPVSKEYRFNQMYHQFFRGA